VLIRAECPSDIAAIVAVHRAAFANVPYSAQTEDRIVDALRAADALYLSLVAEEHAAVVGHIAFAPVRIGGQATRWVGLGPVGVLPSHQGRGIGAALIEHGLRQLRDGECEGVVVLGEPEYYQRFGFFADPTLTLANVPPQFFLALPFTTSGEPRGEVVYPAAYAVK